MTLAGKRKLEEELRRLTGVERPQVIQAIEVARGHGDLSENADYSAAKERQSFIEGRIQEINAKLALAQVINPSEIRTDKIVFGATVSLEEQASGNKFNYQIVGVDEADIKNGKIGVTSPIARALIGKKKGESVTVHAPKGEVEYDILDVHYK